MENWEYEQTVWEIPKNKSIQFQTYMVFREALLVHSLTHTRVYVCVCAHARVPAYMHAQQDFARLDQRVPPER